MTSQMTLANANGVGLRTSEAPFAAADGYAAWWTAGWQRKLGVLRSVQHVDNVCGIRWGESYRTHHNAIRSKAMKRRELAKERMRHTDECSRPARKELNKES